MMSNRFPRLAVDDLPADLPALLEVLADTQPAIALALVRALDEAGAPTLRATANRLLETLANDSRLGQEVDVVVASAGTAQETFENWTDERIDGLLLDVAKAFAASAKELAIATVRETGMGNAADKTLKNRFASLRIYASLAGKIAQGPLCFDAARQVTELASPVGVVFAVVPVTNPVATAMFKTLIALKARNAVILSFHHQALGVGQQTVRIVRDVLKAQGAPVDLVQCVQQRSRKTTRRFMSHPRVALVLATGGRKMVEAAYSSGTPAIGVGPGNAPAWICVDADLDRAARAIVESKTFDNGLICGAEHNLVVDSRVALPFNAALMRHGAAILTPDEERRFTADAVDANGNLRREFLGQSAKTIAAALDIVRPYALRLLVVRKVFSASDSFYTGEKLAPLLSMFTVAGEDEGLRLCRTLLKITGAGHTAVIHSTNAARVERFARAMPAGRILVNSAAAQGCCGMTTGLDCSLTLGCGTFGGNSTTDNVTFRHLLNIKRVARPLDRAAHQDKRSA
jgi:acyl-CoA reductase-like NAD-dependent aldehyde dehydrogenase